MNQEYERRMDQSNESKIQFSNAFRAMQNHLGCCEECCEYMYDGDGDLCDHGKEIIAFFGNLAGGNLKLRAGS